MRLKFYILAANGLNSIFVSVIKYLIYSFIRMLIIMGRPNCLDCLVLLAITTLIYIIILLIYREYIIFLTALRLNFIMYIKVSSFYFLLKKKLLNNKILVSVIKKNT